MIREVSIDEISDGKLYTANDMVKADCQDCRGCSACCHGMGASIVLTPLDVHRLMTGLNKTFQELLETALELNVCDGLILPNLKMAGKDEACTFLNEDGRCTIHPFRPGICRIFPLGRFYENGSFQYFLQIHECKNKNRSKIKVKKWVDEPQLAKHEAFISHWHYYLKQYQVGGTYYGDAEYDEERAKKISMHILTEFYGKEYDTERDFYEQYYERVFL